MVEKPKLAILVNSLAGGGAERVAFTLYQAYRSLGIDVLFLCLEKNDAYLLPDGQTVYLSAATGAGSGAGKFAALPALALRLKKLVADRGITHVQSHIYRANYVNVMARKLGAGHWVQIVNHGMPGRYSGEGLKGRTNLALIRWLYPAANQLVCPCDDMLRDFAELKVNAGNGTVIPNPFDVEAIRTLGMGEIRHPWFRFEHGKRYLIAVGRLEPVKRVGDIISALHLLQHEFPGLELIILGAGSEQEKLKRQTGGLHLGDKVHFVGHQQCPYPFMARADVLVSASESEGFGNVLVEALICGTPVVSTDCPGGPRDIVAVARQCFEREPGLLVPVGDVAAIANGVRHILVSADMKDSIAESVETFGKQFDAVSIARRYLPSLSEGERDCR